MNELPKKLSLSSHSSFVHDSPPDIEHDSSKKRISTIGLENLNPESKAAQESITIEAVSASKPSLKLGPLINKIKRALRSFFKKILNSLPGKQFSFKIAIEKHNRLIKIHTNNRPISKTKAMHVFEAITDAFNPEDFGYLQIVAKNNPASDSGGPKREFFSHLLKTILKEKPLSSLFSQEASGAVLTKAPKTEKERDALFRLGKILGLCLNFDIQIGHIIDRSLFTVISKLINQPKNYIEPINLNDETQFNNFFELYKQLESQKADQKDTLKAFEQALGDPNTKEDAKDTIIFAIEHKVIPLIALSKAMSETMSDESKNLVLESPQILPDKILGMQLDSHGLLEQITFEEIPGNIKEWIEQWICDRSPEEVQSFIYAMTGSPTLSPDTKIRFSQTEHLKHLENNPTFEINTCSRLLWMDYNQIESKEIMHAILDMILNTSGFNAK